jgi:phosphonatase-like hydrolase
MIKMVVFDMAGTVVNENNVVYKTLQKAITEAGFYVTLDQVLLEGAGKEKLQAIKSILKTYAQREDDKFSDAIYQQFVVYLAKAYDVLDVLAQKNAVELFAALKQKNIFVVLNTGYNAATAQTLLGKLKWRKGVEYDQLVTASDVARNRPEPDMIIQAMGLLGIENPKQVVKVGDSIIDIEEGKNAGCALNIGITTGAHTREQLKSALPDYVIDDLIEILPLLKLEEAK